MSACQQQSLFLTCSCFCSIITVCINIYEFSNTYFQSLFELQLSFPLFWSLISSLLSQTFWNHVLLPFFSALSTSRQLHCLYFMILTSRPTLIIILQRSVCCNFIWKPILNFKKKKIVFVCLVHFDFKALQSSTKTDGGARDFSKRLNRHSGAKMSNNGGHQSTLLPQ